ncbi:MAG TPA: hypothetical protein VGO61_17990 [Steroidobacteraceae bacterium]|jgi:hypothetical protein|nr:hypothetical protein [Steroidobacteraceae bacterium]HEV7609238.1 hypothetical protein [Steroidobacteraceae bacterium]
MPILVLRKSVDYERVVGPFRCANPQEIARILGRLTLEERVRWLLKKNEIATDVVDGQGKIYRGRKLVGYIVVLSNE